MKRFLVLGALVASIGLPFGTSAQAQATTPFTGQNGDIAFAKTANNTANVWTMQADGTHAKPIACGGTDPVWSPDGKRLLFTNKHQQLRLLDYQTGSVRTITPGYYSVASRPAWSKDGSRVAFVAERLKSGQKQQAVLVMRLDTKRTVSVVGWTAQRSYQSPSWSPDGTQLVYEQLSEQQAILVVAHAAGHQSRTLTTLSDVVLAQASWSPNGKKILYRDSADEVYTIWADGSHRSTIADGESYDASWSADGSKIVFLESHNGEGISVSSTDGTVTNIPVDQGSYDVIAAPMFSPDSTKILFAMTNTTQSVTDLFVLDLGQQNAQPTKIATGVAGGYDWQARSAQR